MSTYERMCILFMIVKIQIKKKKLNDLQQQIVPHATADVS